MKVITKEQFDGAVEKILEIGEGVEYHNFYNALPDGYSKEQIEAVLGSRHVIDDGLLSDSYKAGWYDAINEIRQELTKLDKEAER